MGSKYTVCFNLGNDGIKIGTEYLVVALWLLFFHKCQEEYAWKSLEVRS